MNSLKSMGRLLTAGVAVSLSNAALAFGFSFNLETQTVYENIVPVEAECIERVNNSGALLGFQAYLDGMLAACAAGEALPYLCQQDVLIGQCVREASVRTFLSQKACQTTADAVVTVSWEWVGTFIQTSGESTQTYFGIPHIPEEQQQIIIADKQTMLETCFAIQPELIIQEEVLVEEEEVVEEEIIEEEVIEEEEVLEEEEIIEEEIVEEEVIEEEVVEEEELVEEEEVIEEEEELVEEEEEIIEEEVVEEEEVDVELIAQGRAFWDVQCAFCHGANGEGAPIDPTPVLPGECTVPEAGGCQDLDVLADYIAATMPPPGGTCVDDCAEATAALIFVSFQEAAAAE